MFILFGYHIFLAYQRNRSQARSNENNPQAQNSFERYLNYLTNSQSNSTEPQSIRMEASGVSSIVRSESSRQEGDFEEIDLNETPSQERRENVF